MAKESVSDYLSLLEQQVFSQELLLEYFFKIEAMLEVSLCSSFLEQPKFVIHDYLWALNDFAKGGKALNFAILDVLLKNLPKVPGSPQKPPEGEKIH
jgi:hypothetical protein